MGRIAVSIAYPLRFKQHAMPLAFAPACSAQFRGRFRSILKPMNRTPDLKGDSTLPRRTGRFHAVLSTSRAEFKLFIYNCLR